MNSETNVTGIVVPFCMSEFASMEDFRAAVREYANKTTVIEVPIADDCGWAEAEGLTAPLPRE